MTLYPELAAFDLTGFQIETKGPLLYRANYKYRLEHGFSVKTPVRSFEYRVPSLDSSEPWVQVETDGWQHFREGYCYDGPSGPTIDTPDAMEAAASHDGFYQGARLGHLPQDEQLREFIDRWFRRFCIARGMNEARADLWYEGIRVGAGCAWKPQLESVYEAPSGRVHRLQPGSVRAQQLLGVSR